MFGSSRLIISRDAIPSFGKREIEVMTNIKTDILMKSKVCSKCKVEKPASEFTPRKDRPVGLYSCCKKCKAESRRILAPIRRAKDPVGQWAIRVLGGARYRDKYNVHITKEDVLLLAEDAHELCAYCDKPLDFNTKAVNRDNAPTLDRIDPRLDYTLGNTVICCHKCNARKSDSTPEELHQMADRVSKLIDIRRKNDFGNCRN